MIKSLTFPTFSKALLLSTFILLLATACDTPKSIVESQSEGITAGSAAKTNPVKGKPYIVAADMVVPEGQYPIFPIWESFDPRKRACSVNAKERVVLLEEIMVKDERYAKIKAKRCTGYFPFKLLTAQ